MNLKTQFKHRIKMMIAGILRFVVSHPRLLALGMVIAGGLPPLKRFLTRVHVTTNLAVVPPQAWAEPQQVPLSARSVYLQLTAEHRKY